MERLEPLANAPRQWSFIARYWAMRQEPARGLDFAHRAVREDPTCVICYHSLALLLHEQGSVFEAVQVQRVAVALSSSRNAEILARLDLYERDLVALNREAPPAPVAAPDVPALGDDCVKAVAISRPAPTYPPQASANHVQGVVRARFVVREDGSVTDVAALSGPALLAAAAVAAIQTWRFSPAHCGPRAVASPEEARVPFALPNP